MNRLFETHIKKVERTDVGFVRNLMNEIDWNARLIGLKGARGVGKTTLLLQRCKLYHKLEKSSIPFGAISAMRIHSLTRSVNS